MCEKIKNEHIQNVVHSKFFNVAVICVIRKTKGNVIDIPAPRIETFLVSAKLHSKGIVIDIPHHQLYER